MLRSGVEEQKSFEEFERNLLERRLDSYIQFLSAKDREELLIAASKILAYGSPAISSQMDDLYSAIVGDENLINAEDTNYKNLRILVMRELKKERVISETSLIFRGFWEFLPIPYKRKILRYFITYMRLEFYKSGIQIKLQDQKNDHVPKSWWQFWRRG